MVIIFYEVNGKKCAWYLSNRERVNKRSQVKFDNNSHWCIISLGVSVHSGWRRIWKYHYYTEEKALLYQLLRP